MNRLENMETFARIVEAGSISAAAERIGVAISVASRRLKELEGHLGIELFHRTTRKLNLTDAGESFYRDCLRILDEVEQAEIAVADRHERIRGRLKLALPSSFGHMHVGPAILDFLQLHPEVEFDLDFNDREVDLMQEGFDLAIRLAALPDSSLMARKLASIRRVMCASPDYLAQHGTPGSLDELAAHRCLVYSLISDLEDWQPEGGKRTIKSKPYAYMKSTTGEFLRDAAVAAQGIAVLPTFFVYQEIEKGELVTLLDEIEFASIEAYAIYPPTRHLSRRVRAFIDFLSERFAGSAYWDDCLETGRRTTGGR